GGGCTISCWAVSGSGEPSAGPAVCQSIWTASQDRQAGCVCTGNVWENDATQTVYRQNRGRKATECPAGETQTAGRNAESRAKPPAHHVAKPKVLGGRS